MKTINNFIIEKLKKINSKNSHLIETEEELKDAILNENNKNILIQLLVKYCLVTKITNQLHYKDLLKHKRFIEAERYYIYRDLKNAIAMIAFDDDIINVLSYGPATIKEQLKKKKYDNLYLVFQAIINYFNTEQTHITDLIKDAIEEYFEEHEKDK